MQWDASGNPISGATSSPAPAMQWDASGNPITPGSPSSSPMTANSNGEGTYQLTNGKETLGVPYSKINQAVQSGYAFANPDESLRFRKDHAYDPNPDKEPSPLIGEADPALSVGAGAAKGALQTATGAAHLVHAPVPKALDELAATPSSNMLESAGVGMENIAEFLMGDEVLKGMSYTDRLAKVLPAMKAIERSPALAKAVATAIRQGTVSGVQSALKTGGDPEAVALSTILGGTAGGLAEGAASGVKAGAENLNRGVAEVSPTEEEIAGQKFTRLKSQPKGNTVPTAAQERVQIGAAPEVQAGQQTAAKGITRNTAQEATRGALERLNEGRGATEGVPLWEEGPGGVQGEPTGETTTPNPQIDIPATVARVGSWPEALKEIRDAAATTYQRLDAETDGQFSAMRKNLSQAQDDVWDARQGKGDLADAQSDETAANIGINTLFDDLRGKVSPQEYEAAKAEFRHTYIVKDISRAVENSFNVGEELADQTGIRRGMGSGLLQNLNRVVAKHGYENVAEAIGKPQLDNLTKLGELMQTRYLRARTGGALQQIADYADKHPVRHGAEVGGVVGGLVAGGHGAAVGATIGAGAGAARLTWRTVLNKAATDPKFGQQLTYALEYGARSEKYIPFLGKIVAAGMSSQREQGGNENGQQ